IKSKIYNNTIIYPTVTRARARRLSVLDTDSRPGTPQLDLAPERGAASPRPTRRAGLNSSTIDPHTPIRATRASVARGETPDPSTPVSVKRTTRTPAKATRSVKKQLTLKEETAEEAEDRVDNTTPTGERRQTRSMSQTPPNVNRSDTPISTTASPVSAPNVIISEELKQSFEDPKAEKHVQKEKNNNIQFGEPKVRLQKYKESEEIIDITDSPMINAEIRKISQKKRIQDEVSQREDNKMQNPKEKDNSVKSFGIDEKSQILRNAEVCTEVEIIGADCLEKLDTKSNTKNRTPLKEKQVFLKEARNENLYVLSQQTITSEKANSFQSCDESETSNIPCAYISNITVRPQKYKKPNSPILKVETSEISPLKEHVSLRESPNEKLPKNTSENKNLALKNVASEGNDSVFIASNEKRFDSPDLMEVGDSRNDKETNNVEETNSSTIDPRSPIVATTASVARGETPDPSTPGSTRTPAKATRSIKKQLTLKEETAEEAEDGVDNTTPTETNQTTLTGENVPSMEPTNEILQKKQTPLKEHVSLRESPNENLPKNTSENKNHALKNVASVANNSVFIASNEKSFDSLDLMEVDDSCDEKETNNVEVDRASAPVVTDIKRLSNLSPGIMSRIVRSPKEEKKKSVGFLSNNDGTESEKMRFPKTPGRDKPLIYTTPTLKHETPLKSSILCKGRTSSTPLNKYESGDSEIKLAPLEIDAIKSLDQLNAETSTMETIVNAKVAKQPFDFIDNEDDEESLKCEFFDDQAVDAGADYKSGDSMDSSERREINENQISSHGESVGSQDTEETSTENDDEDDSFIVSDYDSDEEKVNALRFSEEEDNFDVETDVKLNLKGSKKRRRIVEPQYSSEEERVELALEQKKIKPNNRRNCSSDTSKLSDAAQSMNGEKSGAETSEAELEASRQMALQALNNSEHLNRTVPRLDATVVDIVSSSDSDSEEKKKRASISIHEVIEPKKEETTTQKSGKSLADEEAALLDRLASNDLRHLADMFNPLQKSRRQSLYTASPELKTKELKLKRRSDRGLGTADEFHPSQSFVELVREQHQNHLERKRKHFSKSFSDFSKDLDDREVCHGPKRLKSSHDTEGQMPLVENTDNEEIPKSSYKKS
ncbi:hypothetical protein KR018_004579, partial [Drosophila ironensis]